MSAAGLVMNKRRKIENLIVALLLSSALLFIDVNLIDAGATSTPKNLVNPYSSNLLNDSSSSNSANLNQFQNEYQYRQSATKPTSPDRSKPTTPFFQDPGYEHAPSIDPSNGASTDYSYSDSRGTTNVPDCKGRLRLNESRGFITDGLNYYDINLQCSWLIDSGRDNATIRIRFHQFATECNYDYVYIFDGDSIFSPLIAALSGDIKDFSTALTWTRHGNRVNPMNFKNTTVVRPDNNLPIPIVGLESQPLEIGIKSRKAFIYFHSDTAQRMPGFYMTYSIDACPLDCSNRGECDYSSLVCQCNQKNYGDGCQYSICPNNCTSPENGYCDEKISSCICMKGFYGEDCSKNENEPHWFGLNDLAEVPPRAFHKSVVVDERMWVIGGRSATANNANNNIFRRIKTELAFYYDLMTRKWSNESIDGFTGSDHLAEISGHSVTAKGSKVFIYGGLAMNNSILDSLSVLDTKEHTIVQISNGKRPKSSLTDEDFAAPIAVVGHTANIIDSYMYIFLGYNPLYGYINLVQKFNLADNSWSIVERKGSHVEGCIGHSSTFDPIGRLVYVYGGPHSQRSNHLYSFDPHTEVWTFLQSGPSPRYYHDALILNQQLIIIGGNSYNYTHQNDQCFQQSYLLYDLSCSKIGSEATIDTKNNSATSGSHHCGRTCWKSIEDNEPGLLKRYGHTVVNHNSELFMFGGFNGVIMNDLRYMKVLTCDKSLNEASCERPQLGLSCRWDAIEGKCQEYLPSVTNSTSSAGFEPPARSSNCTKNEIKALQIMCEARETCSDCLNTNLGCVWCGFLSQCQYSKCKSSGSKATIDSDLCFKDESSKSSMVDMSFGPHPLRALPAIQDYDTEIECKRIDNCYLCQSKPSCAWQNDDCAPSAPNILPSPASNLAAQEDFTDMYGGGPLIVTRANNSTRALQRYDPFNRSFLASFTSSLINSAPYHSCDVPCYLRRSCNECTRTKCIWCSTTEQCFDSSAYFAYHAMGQCMHYVAHTHKCPIASCADIETCDRCLANPKCGWLNDIDNRGKGRCMEGTQSGPFGLSGNLASIGQANISNTTQLETSLGNFPNWYYTSCPPCQCNGHTSCKAGSSICIQPCQDNTEGPHCNRCMPGFYGDPTNGGTCRLCRCNGHATYCNRETGRCYCSTKGVTGHNCNKCDDQNHYIGDPLSPSNGTCYYNLTTDYQYTFNMSKPEDHYYSDINFINVPSRKDSDVEFSIACSRLALVNITSGTSYKNRRPIHTIIECGSHTLRFPYDRYYSLTESNYSIYVHVYKFQTPFILQIAFSQHRTLKLPQFFLTFSG